MAARLRFLNPKTLAIPSGYSSIVDTVTSGRTIYIAGQLGLDLNNNLVGAPGDFRAQCTKAFENLEAALSAVGAKLTDVAKINNYLVDMSHLPVFRELRDRYFSEADKPVSTTVAISQLARAGALFEIDAIAVLPAGAAAKPARRKSASKSASKSAGKASRRKAKKKR